jgi:cytochrome c oxidase cbb3-type subunit 4
MISGIVTAVLLATFLGITVWAYSSRQRERFRQAAHLPLDDEARADAVPSCCSGQERRP